MLDFRVDTFLEVCRLMNYTRAAEQLNLTQPAVSQHIRWLEEQCGVKLFHYENKQLNLTAAGRNAAGAGGRLRQPGNYPAQFEPKESGSSGFSLAV